MTPCGVKNKTAEPGPQSRPDSQYRLIDPIYKAEGASLKQVRGNRHEYRRRRTPTAAKTDDKGVGQPGRSSRLKKEEKKNPNDHTHGTHGKGSLSPDPVRNPAPEYLEYG